MTNEKIILQLEKGYDIKNPQLAQVLTNIENNGVTKEEFTEAMETKADLVGGKVPAEQLPSYVDDVINFWDITTGVSSISTIINNVNYTNRMWFITKSTSSGSIGAKYPNKFIDFGANTSEEDWTIIEPEEGKIYIKIGSGNDSNHSFRWSGINFIDLDKNWSDRIEYLGLKTYTLDLGTITDPLDLSESTNTSQFANLYTYLNQRYKFQLLNLLWYYNGVAYNSSIIDVDPIERTLRIYNQGYLQTYKILKEDNNYSLEKISSIPGYVYFDYNDASINKIAANSLKTNKAVPALLVMDGYVFTGYCTKVNEDTTTFIVFNKQAMETYYMNNLTGRFTFINTLDTDTIVNYDSIRGSKTNAEAKQELINILAGDTVVLDYNNAGQVLDNNTINALKKANSIILLNDNTSIESSKSIYTVVTKTNAYLYFCTAKYLASNGGSLTYNELTINLANSSWNIYSRDFIFPYGAFLAEGYTGKSQAQVNKEIANVSLLNFYKITNSDLNKVHSGDKLENIKNATFLILDEGSGKTKIFVRGYTSTTIIYYNCISNSGSVNSILLRMPSNTLSSIETTQFDDVFYSYYSAKGGTKANKNAMYNELIAQLTENTYVLDSSKLNTVLTNEEDTAILNATTIIVSNYPNNKPMVFIRGYDQTSQISFLNTSESVDGSVVFNKLKYIKDSKIASIAASVANPYQWYATHGGTIKDQSNFESINAFLYDRTYIIDKTLLNTTITDISIQDSIKRANILVVKDSTDSSYKVHIRGFVTSNMIYFFNLQNANSDNITATRVLFNTTTNLLSSNDVYLRSAFNAYKLGGGTKYTTETAFNTAFAAAIDAYTSTI